MANRGGHVERPPGVDHAVTPRPYPPDVDPVALTPPQQRVVDELLELGGPRPLFARDVGARLRDELEGRLAPAVERLGPKELWVNKRALTEVLTCERHHVAQQAHGFGGWSPATAKGTVVHKAIELAIHMEPGTPPLAAVDGAVDSLAADGREKGPGAWLASAGPVALAELRAEAGDCVTKFHECWPPIDIRWRPRTESAEYIDLCDDRLTLQGKVDLAFGRARQLPEGGEARVLVVDLKTGHPYPGHRDDLRFYALVHAIRAGVPPFRVASYYLDGATFHTEDVTEDLLFDVAVPRAVEGITKMVELHLRDRAPTYNPAPACAWCPEREGCAGPAEWQARLDDGPFADDRPL